MSSVEERSVQFECEGDTLLGIVAGAAPGRRRGVLIVVGGPQYRAGSHRQFTLLARRLAAHGYPSMRFDYRGMGDSEGAQRAFDTIGADIEAAIMAFRREVPDVEQIVLWALCDGASAAMMYATSDPRVSGIVVLNPWVSSATTLARARVRHYYPKRLLQRAFWSKLMSGDLRLREAARGFAANILTRSNDSPVPEFMMRMREGIASFCRPTLLVLSANDLVARQLSDLGANDAAWRRALSGPHIRRIDLADADHTFSRQEWREAVERHTLAWLEAW